MKGLVCIKDLILYLGDDGDFLKSFKQGSRTINKEGYKQTNRESMGLGAETGV